MTEETFWAIIEQSRENATECEEQAERLQQILAQRTPAEIIAFEVIFNRMRVKAYRWDLWGVAYLVNGSCSDDGFEYFRWWLIGQGKEAYYQALDDPDSIADLLTGEEEFVECEDILYAVSRAYEQATGKEMPPAKVDFLPEPQGDRWDEDDLEKLFPRVAQKFNW